MAQSGRIGPKTESLRTLRRIERTSNNGGAAMAVAMAIVMAMAVDVLVHE